MAAPLTPAHAGSADRPGAAGHPGAEPVWPEVYSYLHHSFLCDVLRGHPGFDDWLAATFLRLYAHEDFATAAVPFNFDVGDRIVRNPEDGRWTQTVVDHYRRVPLLALEEHDREAVATASAAAAFLAEATGPGTAVLVYAEKLHVPGTDEYGRASSVHQVMYTRGTAPGALRVHCMGAGGRYVRADTAVAEAARACAEARVTAAHRRRVLLLRPERHDGAPRFTPGDLHTGLTRAIDGEPTSTAGESAGSSGGPRITAGLAASRTLHEQAARMLHGELPFDIRPFHVFLEHKQRLAAALDLLARRAGEGAAGPSPSPESRQQAVRLCEASAALRFAMLRCTRIGATPEAAAAWLGQSEQALDQERALHHSLCRETAPTRRPDRTRRTQDQ